MDSSEGAKKYPITLYAEGKSPLQNKSMTHNCQLGNFSRVKEAIGKDAWDEIKNSSIGLIPKLVDSDYVWSAKTVHFLLTRQLAISSANEIWVVIGGQPLRFSLYEFGEITGLNTDTLPIEGCKAEYTSLWTEIGIPHGVGPKYDELVKVFGRCRGWDLGKRKILGLLCILHMGIYGIHHNSRMPLETAKRAFKDEDVAAYPWGRVAFKSLIQGVKMVQFEGKSYTVNGCVHVLLFWAYESIKVFGERFGRVLQQQEIPFLRWGGYRTREDLDKVISKEIAQHGELRVRRLIMKPIAEIYPTWDGENEDIELHNLIVDLVEDKFVIGYWEVKQVASFKEKVKAKNVDLKDKGKNVDKFDHLHKKDKRKKNSAAADDLEVEGHVKKKKPDVSMKIARVENEDYEGGVSVTSILQLVDKMYTRFDVMEANISGLVGGIEGKLEAKFDEKYAPRITKVEDKVGVLEDDMKWIKEQLGPREMENSIVQDWKAKFVQQEEVTSQFKPHPINLPSVPEKVVYERKKKEMVNKLRNEEKNLVKEGKEEKKKANDDKEFIDLSKENQTKENLITKVKIEKMPKPKENKIAQASKIATSDVCDITSKLAEENNKLLDESEENEEEKLRKAKLEVAIDMMKKSLDAMGSLDGMGIPKKKTWPPPPPYPMIDSTGLTYMRKGLVPSPAIYDPLKKVDPIKFEKVKELLRPYEHIPLKEKLREDEQLYRDLITPRKDWPHNEYGWLADYHIASYLRLLRKRSMNVPSPFHTDRIAFIDQWFVSMWVKDYAQFNLDPRKWKFSTSYLDVANGLSPKDMPTYKKWIIDVDIIYLVHQINGNHWIALEIDLVKEKIDCYDCLIRDPSVDGDKKVHEQCRMFTRMIPVLLNEVVPTSLRKKSTQQFKFRRRKGIPQNESPGDCGVYAVKYIEYLALGVVFEGLSDRNIQEIREKMAAEILDEVPDMYAQFL